MSGVDSFLNRLRKAELQTIHQFWLPGESVQSTRDELEGRVSQALISGTGIDERVARLSRTQRTFISAILGRPGCQVQAREVQVILEQRGATKVEIDSCQRMLTERGFIERKRSGKERGSADTLEIPEELASHLSRILDISGESIAPADQLSQKRLPFEIDFEGLGIDLRIEALEDDVLRGLCRIALENCGVIDSDTSGVAALLADADRECTLADPDWRETLEEAGIGTIGAVSLRDFGISLAEPSLIIFQEWIQRQAIASLPPQVDPDTVIEVGVDLLIDIDRASARLEGKATNLTRDGRVPKRLSQSLRGVLCLPRIADHIDGDPVKRVLLQTIRLGLVENFADQLRVHDDRLRNWRKLDLMGQAEILLQRFLEESKGDRWSFHQEVLRRIFLNILPERPSEEWLSIDGLIDLSVSTYLLELEERDVQGALQQRREEDFSRERLQCSFDRLGTDLMYWVVNRMLLLGACEVGITDGRLAAFRITALGQELLGIERSARECRILVNPDFEIMLITEGVRGMRLELQLSRFADRESAERIRRYRVTRESMRRGIRSGLTLSEIQELLVEAADHPLPEPVVVSIRDWGRDLDWVVIRPSITFAGLRPDRIKQLRSILDDRGLEYRAAGEDAIVVIGCSARGPQTDSPPVVEDLRKAGWLVREEQNEELHLEPEEQ